jgi:hypothetical protein
MKRINCFVSLLFVAGLSAGTASAADMFSGIWKMDLTKVSHSPDPSPAPPKEPGVQKIQAIPNGLRVVDDNVTNGVRMHAEYTLTFDGREHPFENQTADGKPTRIAEGFTQSAKKLDDYTIEITVKHNGHVAYVNKDVVSKDGKTRTLTNTDVRVKNHPTMVIVFAKQ